ncbi:MAG: ATP-dependent DNA helicase, partial [Spirochaetales bacterium]|nr:ATP-dependent DNA helicase [Spirochaetales bacterium]
IYSSKGVLHQASRIRRSSRYTPDSLLARLAPYSDDPLGTEGIIEDLVALAAEVQALDQYLLGVFSKNRYQPVLVTAEHRERLGTFRELAVEVAKKGEALGKRIAGFAQRCRVPEELESRLNELLVRSDRIDAMVEVLRSFTDYDAWGDDVHWFNTERHGEEISVEVRITPLSVAPVLVEALFSKVQTVVSTSATLDLHDGFEFWAKRVGLPYADDRPFFKGTFASPFEYTANLLLITPEDAPLPAKELDEEYLEYMSRTVLESTLASGGGALVLFTSYALLTELRERLERAYEEAGLLLLSQGQLDRHTLLRTFVEERDSVLFATSSFWEGVDAPGDTLRLVVITKLPFAVPSDPVFKARCAAIDAAGGSGFFELSLKNATMKLKQGYGRLIRTSTDRGVVLILDSRIVLRRYGQFMLRSLPESFHQTGLSDSIAAKIERFLFP